MRTMVGLGHREVVGEEPSRLGVARVSYPQALMGEEGREL